MLEGKFALVADQLFEVGAVMFAGVAGAPEEGFRLKLHEREPDAPLSPIYLNLRTPENKGGKLTPEIVSGLAELMADCLPLSFHYVAGIPKAGEPFADAVMEQIKESDPEVQLLHLGKVDQEGGRHIVGVQEEMDDSRKDRIVLVDDLITQADTKFEAIRAVEDDNLVVARLVVLVDREQGGVQQLAREGYFVASVFTISELLDHYVETRKINRQKADEVKQYLAASRV